MRKRFGILLLSILLVSSVGACASWERPGVQINGATMDQKLQEIAKVVSKQHLGFVSVIYFQAGSSGQVPGFIVALTVTSDEITTQSDQAKAQNEFALAIVAVLKLTTREVLPTNPSVERVVISTVVDGHVTDYAAEAKSLKALSQADPDETWLSTVQPIQRQQ